MPLPLRLQSNSFATKLSAQVALGAFRKVISDMALSSLNIIVTEVPTPNSSNPLSETYRGVITKQLGVVTSYVSNVHSISGEGCVDDDEKASILFQKATFLYDLSQYSNVLRKILLNGYCSRSYLEREIARWSNSLSMSRCVSLTVPMRTSLSLCTAVAPDLQRTPGIRRTPFLRKLSK
jgi:hypothetical protein